MVETTTFENAWLKDYSALCRGFLFTSPWRSLATQGCYTTISAPVHDAASLQGDFQQQLRQHFAAARKQGIANPILVGAIPFDVSQPAALFIPEAHQTFNRDDLQNALPQGISDLPEVRRRTPVPDHDVFLNMVADAVAATQRGELDKVVLSRLMDIVTEQPVDTATLMQRVIAQNPNSYHFHLPMPQGGALIGASPELMLRKQGRDFSSCPLAGSARRNHGDAQQDRAAGNTLMNSSKDRHEHKLVTDAMRDTLQPRSRLLSVPSTPSLITTATLWHLATQIDGEVQNEQENALSLACLLHPTPALSGFPHQRAQQLIQQLEPFDRQLFGGIVGWCDSEGNGEWVVTIRCGTVHGTRVRLFAGAGIVADSQPESEWRETGVKLDTMLRAFGLQ
ncbi:isochorismate synthase [Candidatus Pantoea floridensis]|uniref:isochorismate synthase n=1 Tax=Candidatus Pantoea floridensis TaxID=1938870 RepID=A0A286BS87_9GAMM|nr:isochorismate synthase [Pantoea floridensis]PIF23527.1 isochorismate synthase [Enterobacteriaceae bacterium JKS000233]SOD36980.1 isochorismate synthase [Pantoea floridensis]